MPHTVKRAVIVAAGRGERMLPLTKDTPKPLIKVNGTRMIESVIGALHQNSIRDIVIVVGYLKERFAYLQDMYDGIRFVENPHYASCNNIASLCAAGMYLDTDTMILDGDQIINNAQALSPYFERSCYNAVWTDKETSEWLLTVKDGIVTHCSRTGGKDGWQLYSVSRWTEDDAKKLNSHLKTVFEREKHTELFWDDVALFRYPQDFRLGIHEMKKGDVIEIDSPEELEEAERGVQ